MSPNQQKLFDELLIYVETLMTHGSPYDQSISTIHELLTSIKES